MKYLILLVVLVGCKGNRSPKEQVEIDYPALRCTNSGPGTALCMHRQERSTTYVCFADADNDLIPYPFTTVCLMGSSPVFHMDTHNYGTFTLTH